MPQIVDYVPKGFPSSAESWRAEGWSCEVSWIESQFDIRSVLAANSGSRFVYTPTLVTPDLAISSGTSTWMTGFVDALLPNGWPVCLLYPVLLEQIRLVHPTLNMRARAIIAGEGELAMICRQVASGLGFKEISVVSFKERPTLLPGAVQLGTRFSIIDPGHLTQEGAQASLLINAMEGSERELILPDLCFLNFMLPNGLVVDASFFHESEQLHEEAKKARAGLLVGSELLTGTMRHYLRLSERLANRPAKK